MDKHKRIYKALLDTLDKSEMTRKELVDSVTAKIFGGNIVPTGEIGKYSEIRGAVGSILSEMEESGVLSVSSGGKYSLASSKPVVLRMENCEKEIVALLSKRSMTKAELRIALSKSFGTDKTVTTKDDSILYSLIGQILKRLQNIGVIRLCDSKYEISPEKSAKIENINEILSLKADFFIRLHSKGGEFFEHFIMTLLGKYLSKFGKQIIECHTTGGSADGGIDGIIKTVDPLGFRETIMVQAKNRLEVTNETTVRGFYGAVCAYQGTRGIFATTSDFHPAANDFLDAVDNCVGVNADMIFKMACDCLYGVKRRDGNYFIDSKIL